MLLKHIDKKVDISIFYLKATKKSIFNHDNDENQELSI